MKDYNVFGEEKEEIKPAPLGEQELSDEKKMALLMNGGKFTELKPVGESSEEQKHDVIYSFNDLFDFGNLCMTLGQDPDATPNVGDAFRHWLRHRKSSPTSEPPEEQAALWGAILDFHKDHPMTDIKLREYLQNNFVIHRKRD